MLRYTQDWRDYVTRQARWVDFDHDYKTLDLSYMESVMWAFKELYDSGLAYEGFRCLPYCWNDETPLSAHELRMDDDVYQMRQDPAVTVGYRLETGELALIWTTTPWTLPSNLAMAVHNDVDYVVVESSATGRSERYLLAEARLPAYARELGEDAQARIVRRLQGLRAGRAAVHPAVQLLPRAPELARRAARRLRHHRRRHRRWCTSRRPSAKRTSCSPIAATSCRWSRSARTAGSSTRSPTTPGCTSSTPTTRSSTI